MQTQNKLLWLKFKQKTKFKAIPLYSQHAITNTSTLLNKMNKIELHSKHATPYRMNSYVNINKLYKQKVLSCSSPQSKVNLKRELIKMFLPQGEDEMFVDAQMKQCNKGGDKDGCLNNSNVKKRKKKCRMLPSLSGNNIGIECLNGSKSTVNKSVITGEGVKPFLKYTKYTQRVNLDRRKLSKIEEEIRRDVKLSMSGLDWFKLKYNAI